MANESATVAVRCRHCSAEVTIAQRWTAGGVNDYGGFVLECLTCRRPFAVHLGRDINDSIVQSGAKVLDTYDDELGNRNAVLTKHNLPLT